MKIRHLLSVLALCTWFVPSVVYADIDECKSEEDSSDTASCVPGCTPTLDVTWSTNCIQKCKVHVKITNDCVTTLTLRSSVDSGAYNDIKANIDGDGYSEDYVFGTGCPENNAVPSDHRKVVFRVILDAAEGACDKLDVYLELTGLCKRC